MRKRLYLAMSCYAAIAVLAALILDNPLRAAVWLLLVALAVKTWIASLQR